MFWFLILSSVAPYAAVSSPISCDRWFLPPGEPKAVLVLTHGMNMQPSCMDELAKVLVDDNFAVFRPSFAGHCAGRGEYLRVSARDWEGDARRFYREASAKALSLRKPLHLVAYSFSSLVFQTLADELPFARRVYLAPPLATKFWYPLIRLYARWLPDFSYGTLNPHCAANTRSSGRALGALDVFMQRWLAGAGSKDYAPLLALVEPGDELVSYSGLEEELRKRPSAKLEKVSNAGSTLPKTYKHLIVDEASLGNAEWERMKKLIRKFLEQ